MTDKTMTLEPCPWCGEPMASVSVSEGSTFRWRKVDGCCADGPEVRHDTMADDQEAAEVDSRRRAIEAWNTRPISQPTERGEAVGEAYTMQTSKRHTMAVFDCLEVPAGTKLYTAPPPAAGVPDDAEAVSACLGDDAAAMLQANPDDERALNMQRAAQIIDAMLSAAPSPKGQGMTDMQREAFERWARANGGSIKICTDRGSYLRGSYEHIATHEQWIGWQAAIRHLTEQNEQRDSHE